MRQRYEVFCDGEWFTSVHALTAEEAITRACRTTGTHPVRCVAVEVTNGRADGTGR